MKSLKKYGMSVFYSLFVYWLSFTPFSLAREVEFNTDVLDIQDRENMDLTQFSRSGYIMPGDYLFAVKVNGQNLAESSIRYRLSPEDVELPQPLLSKELVAQFGLKRDYQKQLAWAPDGGLLFSSLPGMKATADLGRSTLIVSVPQIYLEYVSNNWDPPSRWDNGVAGLLFGYNLNASTRKDKGRSEQHSLTGSGTMGANLGAWRLRGDWQMQNMLADNTSMSQGFDWSRYYLYRPLPDWRARLTLGENYLSSDIFDSFRYAGTSLESDISMLPPSLRGYAPEVNGVAESNATVVISQQGRVLYQTDVAPGPFSIQDLDSSVSGTLDVEVREQEGEVKRYQVSTATLPYLTRPGAVRYKFFAGRPTDWQHEVEGPMFGAAEASWGVTNGWSMYGGGLGSDGYQALTVGVGRDLYQLGALSSDVTVARSRIADQETRQGKSWRVSYAKTFEEYNSQVTFAGYRFSEEDFYSMAEYLTAIKGYSGYRGNSKERYDISFNHQFAGLNVSTYLNYTHQSYWNQPATDRFELSANTYLDTTKFKNISLSARAYRQSYYGQNDNGVMLSLNVPWGSKGYLTYSGNKSRGNASQSVGYSGRTEGNNSYNVRTTVNRHSTELSGFLTQRGDVGDLSLSATGSTDSRKALSMGLNGGLTATSQGVVFHGGGSSGGTRLVVDTDGVGSVPLKGGGRAVKTNAKGLAVISGVSSYNRTYASVELAGLGDQVDAVNSVVQVTLTEGAIGYRKMEVIDGHKGLANIRMQDGKMPPFGATVLTAKGKSAGIVGDDGAAWLSGMKPGEKMRVQWNGVTQCEVELPADLSGSNTASLLLPCVATGAGR
ncbi:fimbria/pilus outer membrane usher protein [Buttiauxella gaviniae]|uniref:fimbria/pilus outer membrane usher protein n=1 Tax=Buttiauxella gaviniae TaxID=82990 RepID=UPI003975BE34